jgi:methyl-accepting chemotaxis protein
MAVGDTRLQQNRERESYTPIVDDVVKLVGGTATIFQKMNKQGDMLRVATTVVGKDGTRAIATYIPAVNPDGAANPVVSAVLSGKAYHGRAFVVDSWYTTAYEPITDAAGEVIGMIYMGVKQENVPSLRKALLSTKIGQSGYVFVIGGSGDQRGHYIISKDGARDGENVWEMKDADGTYMIQSLVTAALQAPEGTVSFQDYLWQNQGEASARGKTAAVIYFQPWDWVIGVSVYQDDFDTQRGDIEAAMRSLLWNSLVGGLGVLAVALGLAFWGISRSVTRPLREMVEHFKDIAEGEGDLTRRVVITNQDEIGQLGSWFNTFVERMQNAIRTFGQNTHALASASEELTSVSQQMSATAEETSAQAGVVSAASQEVSTNIHTVAASGEEMSASIKEIAKNASDAARVAGQAVQVAETTNTTISQLGQSSAEIGQVVKVITSIAEQTNLLALNATIEAARAGEAGKGFAVVANEVKELAKQTAQATEDISHKIGAIQGDTQAAVEAIGQIGGIIHQIHDIANTIASAVEEQSVTTNEITRNVEEASRGSGEITQNIGSVAQAAQSTANGATQTQEAAQELARIAAALQQLVNQFKCEDGKEERGKMKTQAVTVGRPYRNGSLEEVQL